MSAAAAALAPMPVRAGEYEGPLDLLLELVRRQQLTLEQLPLAEITGQYLDYLRAAKQANINLGAEFIYVAATLIQIKSRQLLPQDPALRRRGDPDDAGAAELLDRLREHARARAAAGMLRNKLEVEETAWSRGAEVDFNTPGMLLLDAPTGVAPRPVTLADLIDTLGETLRRVRAHTTIAVEAEQVTVEDRSEWLRQQLAAAAAPLRLSDLFAQQKTPAAQCCLFLGALELGRAGVAQLEQGEPFGEVTVDRAA